MSQSTVKKIPNNYFDGMPVTGFHKIVFFIIMMAYFCECEQSRKLRISVTRIENGPDPFFKYGMVFALINLFERRAREKRRGACQNRHKPRLFFYACSFAASTAVSLVRLIS